MTTGYKADIHLFFSVNTQMTHNSSCFYMYLILIHKQTWYKMFCK